jgi:UDP-3-O-[3-hydroxymyristoyl] glucosamine N-acyltransferase
MILLKDIIDVLQPTKIIGDLDRVIKEPLQLKADNKDPKVIMWANSKSYDILRKISNGVLICNSIKEEDISENCTYLIVDKPRKAFMELLHAFFQAKISPLISQSAKIAEGVIIGKDIFIGENVVIENGSTIGNNTIIDHNTVIKRGTIIGDNVKIGANNVIGGIGFGYEKDEIGQYKTIPHIGNVVIENNVEIGNNSTIDRAVLGSTILKENVKIDNLVHVSHGVIIGENTLIIANSMIAGSVVIGKNTWVSPSSSVLNKITIGDNATIGMGAVVIKTVKEGEVIVGNPGRKLE